LRIIPSELQAEEVAILNRLRQGESVSHYETVRLAKNGQRIPVSLTISPIRDAAGVILGVSKIARDITGRKQAEEALWQARNELEVRVCERTAELTCANAALRAEKAFSDSLIELAPAIIAVVNAQGHLVRTNAYAEQLGGYPFAETEGRNMISLFLPKDDQSRMRHVLREALQGRAAQGVVAPFRTRAGKIRHIEWFSKPLASTDGKTATVLAIGHDITDRIKLEEEILHISERERRVIAQDLHDGLGQLLVGTLHLAHTLQKDLAAGSPAKARRLSRIKDIINEAVTQTRDLARGLHPVESVPNGLMAALETLSTRTKKLFQVTCHFNGRRTVLIHDDAIATHLFRIAQEAVTNAIKHASPKHIEISLGETPGRIRLAVKNDGLNLAESPRKPTGMGLRIMHYRARMIGGFLTIQKKAGGGTIIVCTVHVPAKRSEISVRNAPPKKQ
jgi:PAS domain S-box-containing protein